MTSTSKVSIIYRAIPIIGGIAILATKILVCGPIKDEELPLASLCMGIGALFLCCFHTTRAGYGLNRLHRLLLPWILVFIHLIGFVCWLFVYDTLWTQLGNPNVGGLTLVEEAFVPMLIQSTIGLLDWFLFCRKQKFYYNEKDWREELRMDQRSPPEIAEKIRNARQQGLFGPIT